MKAISILFAGAAMLVTAGSAVAQERGGRDLTRDQAVARADQRFARLDVNRDGNLTREEARQGRQARRGQRQGQNQGAGQARQFERLDANRDGSLSREEFAARRAMRAERRASRGNAGRGGPFGADGSMTRDEFRARALQRFARLDTDRNGTVTVAERQAMRQQRQQRN